MTDERLRELESRWRSSASVEDEALYLLERVRVGDLPEDRLKLAAYCGHLAACAALGAGAPSTPLEVGDWISDLGQWGSEVSVRAALAIARLGLPLWEREDTEEVLRSILEAAERWLVDPSEENERLASSLAFELGDLPFTPAMGAEGAGPVAVALAVLASVQEIRDSPSTESALYTGSPAEKLAQLLGDRAIRAVVLSEVGAWALGGSSERTP